MLSEWNSTLATIRDIVADNLIWTKRLQLRINAPNCSPVERKMAEQLIEQGYAQSLDLIRRVINGESVDVPEQDYHGHINLEPELEL